MHPSSSTRAHSVLSPRTARLLSVKKAVYIIYASLLYVLRKPTFVKKPAAAALPLGELVATCKQRADEERSSRSTDGESILEQTPPGGAGAALGSQACEGETGEKLFLFSLQDL